MKTSALFFALAFGLPALSPAQIFVGSGGLPAPLTFDSAPALLATEWASTTSGIPGDGGTFTSTGDVVTAVQALDQSAVTEPLQRITFNSTFEAARHNLTAGYLITQPTVVGLSLLKATLRNTHSQAFSHITVSYNFGVAVLPTAETAPGHQVFFSTNGLPGSWRRIAGFSGLSNAAPVNATLFLGRWLPNTDLHLLWADDNAASGTEGGYTIDNFSISGTVVTNVPLPLSITLTAPATGTTVFTPVTAGATAAGSTAVTNVAFYTNNVLAANDPVAPYSAVLGGLTGGTNTIYARAFNTTGSVYSATNTVRVRAEFAEYTGVPYLQNFDGMGPSGPETPPGWYAGVNLPATTVDVTPGDGSSLPQELVLGWNHGTTGSGERALGTSPTAGERNMVLRLRNSSGQPLTGFTLLYDGEVWRNYTNTASGGLTNYYSTDLGASWIPTTFHFQQPFASGPVPAQSAVDGNLSGNRTADIGGTVNLSPPLPAGGIIYFRWHDANESGTDGALAVDNVRFTGVFPPANDNCAGATSLHDGFFDSINPLNLTTNGDPVFNCFGTLGGGAWYRFQPSVNGRVTLNATPSSTTLIRPYVGSCASLSSLDCGFSSAAIDAFVGNTYYFVVAPYAGNNGLINLNVDVCEAPHDITVVVDSIANVTDGVRVTYRADYSGDTAFNFEWSFDGSFQGSTSGRFFSYTFDPFDTFPDIVSCRIFNSCGNGLGGNTVTPPCGAICLSAGAPVTRSGTSGGGDGGNFGYDTSCGSFGAFSNTKWFRLGILTNANAIATISATGSEAGTLLGVFRGFPNTPENLTLVACTNDPNGVMRFETQPAEIYWLAVSSPNFSTLQLTHGYEPTSPAPANDRCVNAVPMSDGLTYYANTLNATATSDPTPPACAAQLGRGVWYTYTPAANGVVTVNTFGSDFDTALQIYTGTCAAPVPYTGACNNNNGPAAPGLTASVRFNGTSSIPYRIFVGGATQAAGNLVISATLCQPPLFSSVTTSSTDEPGGVRVFYQANFSGSAPFLGYRWNFSDGTNVASVGNTISRFYGPFATFPGTVNITATNACGTDSNGTGTAPPCGSICLSLGAPVSRTGTDGSGANGFSYSNACGNFPAASTRWFRMSPITNAAAFAYVTTEGSTYDTRVAVFRGFPSTPNSLALVECNNDLAPGQLQSRLQFETRPTSNYWLAVNATNVGTLKLTYGYAVSFASLTLTNVNVTNRAVDVRSAPLPSFQYRLRGGTNLTAPLSSWSNLITTNFSNSISASTNILRYRDTNVPVLNQRFYQIERVP